MSDEQEKKETTEDDQKKVKFSEENKEKAYEKDSDEQKMDDEGLPKEENSADMKNKVGADISSDTVETKQTAGKNDSENYGTEHGDVLTDDEKIKKEENEEDKTNNKDINDLNAGKGISVESDNVGSRDVTSGNNKEDDEINGTTSKTQDNETENTESKSQYQAATSFSLNSRDKTDKFEKDDKENDNNVDTDEQGFSKYVTDDDKLAEKEEKKVASGASGDQTSIRSSENLAPDQGKKEKGHTQEKNDKEMTTQTESAENDVDKSNNAKSNNDKEDMRLDLREDTRKANETTKSEKPIPTKNENEIKPMKNYDQKNKTETNNNQKADTKPKTVVSAKPTDERNQKPQVRPSRSNTPRDPEPKARAEPRAKAKSARYSYERGGRDRSRDDAASTRASSRASARAYRPPSRPRTTCGYVSERKKREREFFFAELKRLKDSLRKESSKIKKPKVRDHYPDVFTSLEPYYNTYTANYLINMPELGYKEKQPADVVQKPNNPDDEKEKDLMYTTRMTAIGLCDPWMSLSMDRAVLPKLETAEMKRKRMEQIHAEPKPKSGSMKGSTDQAQKSSSKSKRPEAKQGSTRLPRFPVINPPSNELSTKELYYGDVPMLRDELYKNFSHNGEGRKKADYTRTRQDFYRMELDRLDEYHQLSRPHMRKAYFAYLQNTPGSRKAVYDCMKELEKKNKEENQQPQAVA